MLHSRLPHQQTSARCSHKNLCTSVSKSPRDSWKTYIGNVCRGASKTVAFLRRNFNWATTSVKEKLPTTLVGPMMGVLCIGPSHGLSQLMLEKILDRATRSEVGNYLYRKGVTQVLDKLERPELSTLRNVSFLKVRISVSSRFTVL